MTLYVPKPFLQQKNTVVLIELVGGQQTYANFIDHKIWVYPKQTTVFEEYNSIGHGGNAHKFF